jgi:hypothetical protein
MRCFSICVIMHRPLHASVASELDEVAVMRTQTVAAA